MQRNAIPHHHRMDALYALLTGTDAPAPARRRAHPGPARFPALCRVARGRMTEPPLHLRG